MVPSYVRNIYRAHREVVGTQSPALSLNTGGIRGGGGGGGCEREGGGGLRLARLTVLTQLAVEVHKPSTLLSAQDT